MHTLRTRRPSIPPPFVTPLPYVERTRRALVRTDLRAYFSPLAFSVVLKNIGAFIQTRIPSRHLN